MISLSAMCAIHRSCTNQGLLLSVARNALPEEGQLKAEPVPIRCLHIPGVVPPLRLIVLMIEVVSRKLERVTRLRDVVILRRGARQRREAAVQATYSSCTTSMGFNRTASRAGNSPASTVAT